MSIVSELFERIMDEQINAYIISFLSPFLSGLRKATVPRIMSYGCCKNRKLDEGGKLGTVLIDLSEAFDCNTNDLLIPKLHVYGFSCKTLILN